MHPSLSDHTGVYPWVATANQGQTASFGGASVHGKRSLAHQVLQHGLAGVTARVPSLRGVGRLIEVLGERKHNAIQRQAARHHDVVHHVVHPLPGEVLRASERASVPCEVPRFPVRYTYSPVVPQCVAYGESHETLAHLPVRHGSHIYRVYLTGSRRNILARSLARSPGRSSCGERAGRCARPPCCCTPRCPCITMRMSISASPIHLASHERARTV